MSPEKVCESVRFRCTQMQTHCAQNIPNTQIHKHKYTCRQHFAAQGKCSRVSSFAVYQCTMHNLCIAHNAHTEQCSTIVAQETLVPAHLSSSTTLQKVHSALLIYCNWQFGVCYYTQHRCFSLSLSGPSTATVTAIATALSAFIALELAGVLEQTDMIIVKFFAQAYSITCSLSE